MRGAGAKEPGPWRTLGLVQQFDHRTGSGIRGFESMIRTVDADFSEAKRLDEKLLLFVDAPDRHHRAEESARRDIDADSGVTQGRLRSSASTTSNHIPAG